MSPDSELAQIKLLLYVEALERVIAQDPSLGGKVINSVVSGHWYHDGEGEEFIRRAVLTMEVLERPSTTSY